MGRKDSAGKMQRQPLWYPDHHSFLAWAHVPVKCANSLLQLRLVTRHRRCRPAFYSYFSEKTKSVSNVALGETEKHTLHIDEEAAIDSTLYNDISVILKYMDKVLNNLEFSTKEKKETQRKVWKRIIGKAMLTKREAFAVMGLLRKLIR